MERGFNKGFSNTPVKGAVKTQKDNKKQLIEALRIDRQQVLGTVACNNIYNGIVNLMEDEMHGLNQTVKSTSALDLEKYYLDADKDTNGFVTIMGYEQEYFLRAFKAVLNILKNNKYIKTQNIKGLYSDYAWEIGKCFNSEKMRYMNGMLHAKKQETMSTHHDFVFLFGVNNMGQRCICYRILRRVPNDKVYN